MDNKKVTVFFPIIIFFVTGSKLVQHFDFDRFQFEKPALDAVYGIAFVASLVVLVRLLLTKLKS